MLWTYFPTFMDLFSNNGRFFCGRFFRGPFFRTPNFALRRQARAKARVLRYLSCRTWLFLSAVYTVRSTYDERRS